MPSVHFRILGMHVAYPCNVGENFGGPSGNNSLGVVANMHSTCSGEHKFSMLMLDIIVIKWCWSLII